MKRQPRYYFQLVVPAEDVKRNAGLYKVVIQLVRKHYSVFQGGVTDTDDGTYDMTIFVPEGHVPDFAQALKLNKIRFHNHGRLKYPDTLD